MPIDLSSLVEFLQRGVATVPPVVIAIVLLAGPTAALIGYRMIGYRMMDAARRMQSSGEVEAAPLWLCQDCRSVNELRVSRCYRCGAERDAAGEIELVVDHPTSPPTFFEVPAGSPFAALSASTSRAAGEGPGTRVIADPSFPRDSIAVGPGGPVDATAWSEVGAGEEAPGDGLASMVERRT